MNPFLIYLVFLFMAFSFIFSAKPPADTIDEGDFTSDVPMETTASAPEDIKGVSFLEPDDTQNKKLSEGSLRLGKT